MDQSLRDMGCMGSTTRSILNLQAGAQMCHERYAVPAEPLFRPTEALNRCDQLTTPSTPWAGITVWVRASVIGLLRHDQSTDNRARHSLRFGPGSLSHFYSRREVWGCETGWSLEFTHRIVVGQHNGDIRCFLERATRWSSLPSAWSDPEVLPQATLLQSDSAQFSCSPSSLTTPWLRHDEFHSLDSQYLVLQMPKGDL